METGVDAASVRRAQSAFDAFVAAGFHYHFSGRLSNIDVRSSGGHVMVVAHPADGDFVDMHLEHIPTNVFEFGTNKSPSFLPVDCADCVGGSGTASTPPRGQQTAPPNYNGCRDAGGATWFDGTTGTGGCLGPGASRGFPCGTWSYDSPGKGFFRSWDGALQGGGFSWISLDADGQSCHLGN
jgi:hypothetical protein